MKISTEEITELAEKRYGTNPHSFGGQRDGFKEGFKQAQQLFLCSVSKSLNADELINSLGTPDVENEYIVKPDKHGKWQIEHKHVGSGEPLKQWLTGKP